MFVPDLQEHGDDAQKTFFLYLGYDEQHILAVVSPSSSLSE